MGTVVGTCSVGSFESSQWICIVQGSVKASLVLHTCIEDTLCSPKMLCSHDRPPEHSCYYSHHLYAVVCWLCRPGA